jgi:hypothetical protein
LLSCCYLPSPFLLLLSCCYLPSPFLLLLSCCYLPSPFLLLLSCCYLPSPFLLLLSCCYLSATHRGGGEGQPRTRSGKSVPGSLTRTCWLISWCEMPPIARYLVPYSAAHTPRDESTQVQVALLEWTRLRSHHAGAGLEVYGLA